MTGSRPARAMRGTAALLIVVVAFRVPAVERRFRLALLAGAEPHATVAALQPRAASSAMQLVSAPEGREVALAQPVPYAAPRRGTGGCMSLARCLTARPFRQPVIEIDLTTNGDLPPVAPAALDAAPGPGALAAAAYARLAAGDRRGAVRLFDAALAGDDPRAAAWRRQRDELARHWSATAYSIVREGGDPALAVRPVLGGGQSGGGIAFTPDPLDTRPVAVTLRGSVAHDDGGRSAFVAAGVQWHPFTGVTVAAERLIATGPAGPNAWTARIAAGTDRTYGRLRATAYGEGGIVGSATYAAVQGRAAAVSHIAGVELDPGAGLWSSVQHDRSATVDRVDTGPGLVARAGHLSAEIDYRFRVAGNASPGSGPVLTLSAAF